MLTSNTPGINTTWLDVSKFNLSFILRFKNIHFEKMWNLENYTMIVWNYTIHRPAPEYKYSTSVQSTEVIYID